MRSSTHQVKRAAYDSISSAAGFTSVTQNAFRSPIPFRGVPTR
jgi:hypothetical protein